MESHKQLDLILIGKSGNGKSATGNSILRKSWAFKPSYNTISITKYPQYEATEFQGRTIHVVDCPGALDTDLDDTGGEDIVKEALRHALLANPRGYHAFLIVIKYGNRFTDEEQKSIDIFKHILGEDFIKTHGIVVVSNGDTFDKMSPEKTLTFEEFYKKESGLFEKLLKECNYRIVLFNNITSNDSIQEKQVENLIKIIDTLQIDDRRYTIDDFQKANMVPNRVLFESTEPINEKEMLRFQENNLQCIRKVKKIETTENKLVSFNEVLMKCNDLIKQLEQCDKKNGWLSKLLQNVKSTEEYINKQRKMLSLNPTENKHPIITLIPVEQIISYKDTIGTAIADSLVKKDNDVNQHQMKTRTTSESNLKKNDICPMPHVPYQVHYYNKHKPKTMFVPTHSRFNNFLAKSDESGQTPSSYARRNETKSRSQTEMLPTLKTPIFHQSQEQSKLVPDSINNIGKAISLPLNQNISKPKLKIKTPFNRNSFKIQSSELQESEYTNSDKNDTPLQNSKVVKHEKNYIDKDDELDILLNEFKKIKSEANGTIRSKLQNINASGKTLFEKVAKHFQHK